jgi:hypothetical protein
MRYSYASWPGYSPHIREGLEFFANSKNGNPLIYQDLFSAWKLQTRNVLREHKNGTDLYRAHLPDWAYHWGSNAVKAVTGSAIASKHFSLKEKHRNLALNYLHWFHGLNPLGLVYLSNMSDFGASLSVSEIYHSWFSDGGDWDSAIFSRYGPPPGYIVGGPNASYSVPTISPPANMPAQRAYRDWNSDWPEKSWEVSEPSISYQAAYILLLAKATLANREEALSKSHHNEAAAYSSN